MRKAKILLLLGIWVSVLPFLGFPQSYKDILFSLTGLGIIYIAYSLYIKKKGIEGSRFENFSENSDWQEGSERA